MDDAFSFRRGDPLTLTELEQLIRSCWRSTTCDETDVARWSPEHPAIGQCTSTTYVLNDLLGGRLLGAEVTAPDGSGRGYHYWNLLDCGLEVDLTLEQFTDGEVVGVPLVMERISPTPDPGAERYLELRRLVLDALASWPAS